MFEVDEKRTENSVCSSLHFWFMFVVGYVTWTRKYRFQVCFLLSFLKKEKQTKKEERVPGNRGTCPGVPNLQHG